MKDSKRWMDSLLFKHPGQYGILRKDTGPAGGVNLSDRITGFNCPLFLILKLDLLEFFDGDRVHQEAGRR